MPEPANGGKELSQMDRRPHGKESADHVRYAIRRIPAGPGAVRSELEGMDLFSSRCMAGCRIRIGGGEPGHPPLHRNSVNGMDGTREDPVELNVFSLPARVAERLAGHGPPLMQLRVLPRPAARRAVTAMTSPFCCKTLRAAAPLMQAAPVPQ